MTTLILVPRRYKDRKTAEMVEVQDQHGYPFAIVMIDIFWDKENKELYNKLVHEPYPVIVELVEKRESENEQTK